MWSGIWKDLHYGVRLLAKSPGFTTVAVLSLALGIGANTTIFSVANAILLRPPAFRDPNRLVVVSQSNPKQGRSLAPAKTAAFFAWKEQNQSFEELALITANSNSWTLEGEGTAEKVRAVRVGRDIFGVLGVEPILGRNFLAEDVVPGSVGSPATQTCSARRSRCLD